MTDEIDVLWKVPTLDLRRASVRIRTLLPAMELERAGLRVKITDQFPDAATLSAAKVIIINKSFSPSDGKLAAQARLLGKPVVIDLCDNIFVAHTTAYKGKSAKAFAQQADHASAIVTTNDTLAGIIREHVRFDGTLRVIPDAAETRVTSTWCTNYPLTPANRFPKGRLGKASKALFGEEFLIAMRRYAATFKSNRAPQSPAVEVPLRPDRQTLVWFGASVGLPALRKVGPGLERTNGQHPLQLMVISDDYSAFTDIAASVSFPCVFRRWNLLTVYDFIVQAKVCILPRADSDFDKAKSANRAVLALGAGVPVVADWIDALEPLRDCMVIGDWRNGVNQYLSSPELGRSHVERAKAVIDELFSLRVIGGAWRSLLEQVEDSSKSATRHLQATAAD